MRYTVGLWLIGCLMWIQVSTSNMTDMIFYTDRFYTGAATAQYILQKEVLKNETRW